MPQITYVIFTVAIALPPVCSSAQSWSVTSLHPSTASRSSARAASGDQQGGYISDVNGIYASIWNGEANSWENLTPQGTSSEIFGMQGDSQVGYTSAAPNQDEAALWSGSASSYINLNPAGGHDSRALAVHGNRQGGYARISGAFRSAILWSGTASSAVVLSTNGTVLGMDESHQVGQSNDHAALWSGTAESYINLGPAGSMASSAYAIDGGKQFGSAFFPGQILAGSWEGTASSWTSMHPGTPGGSSIRAAGGGFQVGYIENGGPSAQAGIWNGTAASFVNLHSFLSGDYLYSVAEGISVYEGTIYVVGYAYNQPANVIEAMMWTTPVPEPMTLAATGFCAVWLLRRRGRGRA